MSIYEFVKSVYDNAADPGMYMDIETAKTDIDNFRRDGWNVPDELTPVEYMETYNDFVSNYNK